MAVTPAAVLPGTPTSLGSAGFPTKKKRSQMALKLSPTGLGYGIDKDRQDYTVYCGGWDVGRIYETRGGPDNLRWFWSPVR